MINKQPISSCDVLFVPDYIFNALRANNVTINMLDELIYGTTSNGETSQSYLDKFKNLIETTLSKGELEDLVVVNNMLYNQIIAFKATDKDKQEYGTSSRIMKYITTDVADTFAKKQEFVQRYADSTVDLSTIIVSDNTITKLWECHTSSNMIFVVIKKGFTNFMLYSNSEGFRSYILEKLLSLFFKFKSSPQVVHNSMAFKSYLKLLTSQPNKFKEN